MNADLRSLRLHPAWQWLSRLRLLVRWRDWSDSKLPLFLVGMFYAVLGMDEPGVAQLTQIAALFALLCFFAIFGHIINDYADRDADRAAGKKKILATWSKSAVLSAVAIPAGATIGMAFGFGGYTLALTVLAVLVAILYSLPPARLKERGILGWAAATLAQRTLPLTIIFEALHAWDAVAVLLTLLCTLIGVRFIVIHQLRDRNNDRRAGVHTVATKYGAMRLAALLRILFAFEIACAAAVVAAMSYRAPLLSLAALIYAAGLVLSNRRDSPLSPASYDALSNFYCMIWPISLAILLTVENLAFLPTVLVAAGLAHRTRIPRFSGVFVSANARRLSAREALERGKALAKAGKWTQARLEFLVAMEAMPHDAEVLVNCGECAFALSDLDTSYTLFHQAAKQQPPSSRAFKNLGVVCRLRGEIPEAVACLEKAVGLDPNNQKAYIQLALALHESERDSEALGWLERALSQWPRFTRAAELHRNIARNVAKASSNADAASSVLARPNLRKNI